MSYTGVGVFEIAALLALAPKASSGGCEGDYIQSDSQDCCPVSTWTANTYLEVKGQESLHRMDERKIRAGLAELLAPGFFEALARDAGVGIRAGLALSLQRAFAAFDTVYPDTRWYQDPGQVDVSCGAAGWTSTSVWRSWDPGAASSETVRQLAAVKGVTEGEWRIQGGAVIMSVPTCCTTSLAYEMPTREMFYVIENGQLGPTPWLQSFIDTFDPQVRRMIKVKVPPKLFVAPSSLAVRRTGALQTLQRSGGRGGAMQEGSTTGGGGSDAPMSTGAKVAIGAGVVAVVGGVAYLAMR